MSQGVHWDLLRSVMKGCLKQTGKCPTNGIAQMTSYTTTMVMNDSLLPIIWVVIGLLPATEQVIL